MEGFEFLIILILIGLFLVLALIGAIAASRKKRVDTEKLASTPLLTDNVTIFSKLHEQRVHSVVTTETTHSYFIVFEFEAKRREKVAVEAKLYATVAEGERGLLSYKQIDGKFLFQDFKLIA